MERFRDLVDVALVIHQLVDGAAERFGQLADLVLGLHVQLHIELALGDLLGGHGHLLDGADDGGADKDRDGDGNSKDQNGGQQHGGDGLGGAGVHDGVDGGHGHSHEEDADGLAGAVGQGDVAHLIVAAQDLGRAEEALTVGNGLMGLAGGIQRGADGTVAGVVLDVGQDADEAVSLLGKHGGDHAHAVGKAVEVLMLAVDRRAAVIHQRTGAVQAQGAELLLKIEVQSGGRAL